MRLKEEKIVVILGAIMAFILLATFVVQVADWKINDYNNEIILQEVRVNNLQTGIVDAIQKVHQANWLELLNPNMKLDDYVLSLLETDSISDQWKTIHQDYVDGNTTRKEFFLSMLKLYQQDYEDLRLQYIKELRNLEWKLSKGTPWLCVKYIVGFIQFLLIIISVISYLYLFQQISTRLNKKKG